MPVTEFAVIELRGGLDRTAIAMIVQQCIRIQDAWSRENGGLGPEGHLSSMYLEESDPSALLITAPWESAHKHHEWIATDENTLCNGHLKRFVSEGPNHVLLQHLEPASAEGQLRDAFALDNTFQVSRLTVERADRAAVQGAYKRVEGDMQQDVVSKGRQIWAGWRIEEYDTMDELVVFLAHDVPDSVLEPLTALSQNVETRRFAYIP